MRLSKKLPIKVEFIQMLVDKKKQPFCAYVVENISGRRKSKSNKLPGEFCLSMSTSVGGHELNEGEDRR